MKNLITILFIFIHVFCFSQKSKPNWVVNDYELATKKSFEQKKPILIYFTSGGWSPYCVDLDNLILNTKEFKEWSDTSFILLKLIYPSKFSDNPSEIELKNKTILEGFGNMGWPIYGYPNMLLVQPMVCEETQVFMGWGLIGGLENPKDWISRFEEYWHTGK